MRRGSCKSQYINSGMQLQELNLNLYKTQFLIEEPFLGKDRNLISVRLEFAPHCCLLIFQGYSDSCMKVMFKIFNNT